MCNYLTNLVGLGATGGSGAAAPSPNAPTVTAPVVQTQADKDAASARAQQRALGFLSLILSSGSGDPTKASTSKIQLGSNAGLGG